MVSTIFLHVYFNNKKGIAEQRKLDQAARRIHKVIKFTKACDKMRAEYAEHAKQVKNFVFAL